MFVRITSGLRLLTKSSKCERTFAFIASVERVVGIASPCDRVVDSKTAANFPSAHEAAGEVWPARCGWVSCAVTWPGGVDFCLADLRACSLGKDAAREA